MDKLLSWFKGIMEKHKVLLFCIVTFIVIAIISYNTYEHQKEKKKTEITYIELKDMLSKSKVKSIYYDSGEEYMTIYLKDNTVCKTLYPDYEDFRKDMLEAGIKLDRKESMSTTTVLELLLNIVLIAFQVAVLIFLKSTQKKMKDQNVIQTSDIKFENVIGLEEIIDDLTLYVSMIKNHDYGVEIGAKLPKGMLLTGQPGTGKTMIAKAIAGEADVPFISMSGSEFQELYKGVGAKRVREMFKIARKNAPCVIFIDEIDAIGGDRTSRKSDSEDRQTINQLLKEMDGFTVTENIFVLAATNCPENLDPALKRAGRFDREVCVNPPRNWEVRKQMFEYYLSNYKVDARLDYEAIARVTSGFTGADIAMICNEASLVALSHSKDVIDEACIEEAIDKKVFKGNRSKRHQQEKDRQIVAYHEAGHAIMKYLCNEPISRVSIAGTTSGVGGAVFGEEQDSMFQSKEDFRNRIKVCVAGRVSEEIQYGVATSGAVNDIEKATELAMAYVCKYGFDEEIGLVNLEILSEADLIDAVQTYDRIKVLIADIYHECEATLRNNYKHVIVLAQALLENEILTGKEVAEILG
ncbi:MAG: AAA family ATPase [Eubacteriales bacterium]|nr:AAA family ATPase [Eubacteriales bacterium]